MFLDDLVHTNRLLKDITPISFNENNGYTFLISAIDKISKQSDQIINVTEIPYNGKIYETLINGPTYWYNNNSNNISSEQK